MSITHDVLAAHHDRDIRTICLLFLDEIMKLGSRSIRIAGWAQKPVLQ